MGMHCISHTTHYYSRPTSAKIHTVAASADICRKKSVLFAPSEPGADVLEVIIAGRVLIGCVQVQGAEC